MAPCTYDTTMGPPRSTVKVTTMASSATMKISPSPSDETTVDLSRRNYELESQVATLKKENGQLREQLMLLSMERQHDRHRYHQQQPLLSSDKDGREKTRSSEELFAMQQAVRESEERHKTLFENMNQGCVYHDASGQTVIANKSALQILGLSMDQMLGKVLIDPQWRFVREDGSTLPIEEYPVMLALQGKSVTNMKMGVYNTKEQRFRWVMLDAMTRCRDGETTPYEAYTIFTDITEEMETKMNLIRAKEMAEEADQLKSAFLATMSHEIRTPLNGIMGNVELILSNDLAMDCRDENREGLQVAIQSGKLLIAIIEDVLDLSKIEAGQLNIVKQPTSIPQLMQGAMQLAKAYAAQKKKEHLKLTLEMSPFDLAHCSGCMEADATRIQQVLNNLTSNAIKFTESGRVSLTVACRTAKNDSDAENNNSVGRYIEFCVEDTGKGIDQEKLGMVFEPFRQVEMGDTRTHGGTGLGLTISKKLVEMMGGEIAVRSTTRGSTFSFTLPYLPVTHGEEFKENESVSCDAAPVVTTQTKRPVKRSGKILLADDDSISRRIAAMMLKKAGFEVLQAEDGVEAVSIFKENRESIACCIFDIMMPNMDGLEATERVREIESLDGDGRDQVPIVALSAGCMKGDREKGLEVGMSDYLFKPVSRKMLNEALERWIGHEHEHIRNIG